MLRGRLPLFAASALLGACTLDLGGLSDETPRPMLMDAGATDAGPGDDGSSAPCDPGEQRCEGGRAISCDASGRTVVEDCSAMGQVCTDSEGAPHCAPSTSCTPGARRCIGSDAAVCRPDGSAEDVTPCPAECAAGSCIVEPTCDATPVTEGQHVFQLCGKGDDLAPVARSGDSCRDAPTANGEDMLLRWDVPVGSEYRIHLRNEVGDSRFVDPVLYIRSDCGNAESQLACDDDGLGYPDSGITRFFSAGTYFIAVDSYNVGAVCGEVRMLIQRTF